MISSLCSSVLFHSKKSMYNCCSKFTQGHSKTRAKKTAVSLCLYLTLCSHMGKQRDNGKDLHLSFRLAIVERVSGKPAPEILHLLLTQSLSYNWVNESHYSWEALCSYLWTNFQHLRPVTEPSSELLEGSHHFTVRTH